MVNNKRISTILTVEKLLDLTLVFLILGLLLELFLLGHYEEKWQPLPIFLLGLNIVSFPVYKLIKKRINAAFFLFSTSITGLVGLAGMWLHFQSNMQFEREMNADASMQHLILESFSGAMPVFAPGALLLVPLVSLTIVQFKKYYT